MKMFTLSNSVHIIKCFLTTLVKFDSQIEQTVNEVFLNIAMYPYRLVLRRAHPRRRGGLVPGRIHGGDRLPARARAQPAPAVPTAGPVRDVPRPQEAEPVTLHHCSLIQTT